MKQVKYKVFAYITNRQWLLLFTHLNAPEAGIQVPAGTIEAGESPEEAVLREVFEETGLSGKDTSRSATWKCLRSTAHVSDCSVRGARFLLARRGMR